MAVDFRCRHHQACLTASIRDSQGNLVSQCQTILYFNAARVMHSGTVKYAKLQSDHYHPNTIAQFSTHQMLFLWPNQQYLSTEDELVFLA